MGIEDDKFSQCGERIRKTKPKGYFQPCQGVNCGMVMAPTPARTRRKDYECLEGKNLRERAKRSCDLQLRDTAIPM